jgi:hypothetical protein
MGGNSPLLLAVANSYEKIASLLLDRGADPNLATSDGYTPLMHAASLGNVKMVARLFLHGATLGDTTDSGLTAADIARNENLPEIADLLRDGKEDRFFSILFSKEEMDLNIIESKVEVDVVEDPEKYFTIQDKKIEVVRPHNLRGGRDTGAAVNYSVLVPMIAFVMYCAHRFSEKQKRDDDVVRDIEEGLGTSTAVRGSGLLQRGERIEPRDR